MLRKIRITLAIISILAITALFLDFSGSLYPVFGWLAKIQLIPAVLALNVGVIILLVALTLLLGRVYCSVICPLGVFQDAVSRLRSLIGPRKSRRGRFGYRRGATAVRIVLLVLFVALIVSGLTAIAALIEPYSEYGRMVSSLLAPLYDWLNNGIADVDAANGRYTFYHVARFAVLPPALIIALITLVVVASMAWFGGRTYCNTICPAGTVLGFLSRFSWLKPRIDTDVCNGCGRCARNCKASCIDPKNHRIDYSRCVACMDCIDNCTTGAITYSRFKRAPEKAESVDSSRRAFAVMATAVTGAAIAKAADHATDGSLAPIVEKERPARTSPIAPRGARSVKNFTQHCTACQLCISKCPSGVLRPSMSLDRLMQPEVSYERGYCDVECTVCSDVCPAGAIKPIPTNLLPRDIRVGRAVVTLPSCLSYTGRAQCHSCERHCPEEAITLVAVNADAADGPMMPVVNESRCIGCGACESLCPANPVSAIVVEGYESHIFPPVSSESPNHDYPHSQA